ncbi:MAG: hypothetical protein A2698_01245 [Candidatus Levybacteria bacterium RIFCSPHIGHO2_01_FULL_42_15]|nr:MAG: hypothetical protein A2698_01245 [Candidatus Levybacteria bacterium RIFCSPHIGHO2_01_FULL_42_15]
MKPIALWFIFIFSFFIFPSCAFAQVTPTTDQTKTLEQQINSLKDRIASKVATLKLVERRGIIGTVISVTNTQITLSDIKTETRFIDVDELTKFASVSATENFGISDISKGTTLGILGLYNKESKRTLARFVQSIRLPSVFHGAVISVDKDTFTIMVAYEKNKQIIVDVESTTKTRSYAKEDGLTQSGFSKIQEGQRILVAGFGDTKEKNRIIASRVILFEETPRNPAIQVSLPAPIKSGSQKTATSSSE